MHDSIFSEGKMDCPKCHFQRRPQDQSCPRCGVIYAKYESLLKKKDANKDQISMQGPPADNQNIQPSVTQGGKLRFYSGGIILGIITAALIISFYNLKINKSGPAYKIRTASSDGTQEMVQERSEHVQNEGGDLGISTNQSQNNPPSMNTTQNQVHESSSNNRIEEACKAVVTIKTASGIGSGFFINEDGFIITNRHVSRMNDNAQDSLYDSRETLRNQIKESEELIANIESALSGKKSEIEAEDAWISENTDDRYYSKRAVEEKVAEVKAHQAQRQNLAREYNTLMIRYNTERAKSTLLQQKYKEITSEIDRLSYNRTITVYLADGTQKTATIISNSASHDMALLKIDGKTPFIRPAETGKSKIGEPLYAIGAPQGLSQTVTSGILSSFRDGYIQSNAQISPGNSGGPLINSEGKAIGINTSKIVADDVEGIGFAIPIDIAVQEYSQYFY